MKFSISKRSLLVIAVMAIIQFGCNSPQRLRPLSVGDRIPNSIDILGISSSTEGLVILEFISTYCSTCRKSVPHLQELQNIFSDQLQVVLITRQNDSLVRSVAEKHQWTLPIITEDSTLRKLFPYYAVPHQVWIKNGKVIAITDWQYSNEENIRKLLSGQRVKTSLKEEDKIDVTKPLISSGIQPYYQSVISPRINIGSGIHKADNHFLVYNADISELFRIAFSMPAFPGGAYVIADVRDSLRQLIEGPGTQIAGLYEIDSTYLAWRQKFTFCYNLVYPDGTTITDPELYDAMKQGLNQFFGSYMGITGAKEKRIIKCLALVLTDDQAKYVTRGGTPFLSKADQDYKVINQPITLLTGQISYRHYDLGIPVINATGYDGNVDLEFSGGLGNLHNVNQGLKKYGLQFVEKDMEVEVVVISEKHEEIL